MAEEDFETPQEEEEERAEHYTPYEGARADGELDPEPRPLGGERSAPGSTQGDHPGGPHD